jgi:hypothetical protein
MKCTWVDCQNEATKPQISVDGSQWSNLCAEHDEMLDNSVTELVTGGSPAKMISNWIKAQGGAKKTAENM